MAKEVKWIIFHLCLGEGVYLKMKKGPKSQSFVTRALFLKI